MAKQASSKEETKTTNPAPAKTSPEWNEYVMGFFTEEELIDGKPLVAGLRRIAELLIGEIVSSRPINIYFQDDPRSPIGKVTVMYEVQFQTKDKVKIYADVADVWAGNTDDMFAVHAPATASTKAEARALRKALQIRTVAAEELTTKDVHKYLSETEPTQDSTRIDKNQITLIDTQCKKMDIDVIKFINSGEDVYESIYSVPKDKAVKMIKALTAKKNSNKIEPEIKGYKEGWNQ